MFILLSVLLLAYFLAVRSNFDSFFLILFLLGSLALYFKLIDVLINEIRCSISRSDNSADNLGRRTVLAGFYLVALYLIKISDGLPNLFLINGVEFANFFLLLYIPIVIIMRFTPQVSAFFAYFFLILSALYFAQKNDAATEYLAVVFFLFISFSVFHSLVSINKSNAG